MEELERRRKMEEWEKKKRDQMDSVHININGVTGLNNIIE